MLKPLGVGKLIWDGGLSIMWLSCPCWVIASSPVSLMFSMFHAENMRETGDEASWVNDATNDSEQRWGQGGLIFTYS